MREIIIPEGYPLAGKVFNEIITSSQIESRIEDIAKDMCKKYKNKKPVIIGALNGAFIFMADLVRKLDFQFEIDFIKLSSYNGDIKSSGEVKLDKDFNIDLKNRNVVIVEDIIDTGLSIEYLYYKILNLKPDSIGFVSLLSKNKMVSKIIIIDWVAFNIEDKYVIGYGLDLMQYYRGLSGIYAAKER